MPNMSQKYNSIHGTPLQNSKSINFDEAKGQPDWLKSSTFSTIDAEFFQSLNDFKSDFLFNKTESILSKPPHIYRQVIYD